jgi:two-component system chemotaxis response regulator CheY
MGEAMNFCEQCGNRLNAGAKFCGKCGTAVAALQTETQKADVSANAENPAQKAYNEGIACKEAERYDEAIVLFTEALELCTEADQKLYCDALFERGVAYVIKEENDSAIADLTKVSQIDPKNHGAYYLRGLAHDSKGNYGIAIACYNKAIQLEPNEADYYKSRGNAYSSKGNSNAAIADFTKALQLEPDNARIYAYRGTEYVKTGEMAKARADLEYGLHIDPDNERLAWLAEELEEAERQGGTVSAPGVCAQCGTQLEEDEMFCPNCGAKAGEVTNNNYAKSPNVTQSGTYRVLVVDDSMFIANQLGQMLKSEGFEIAGIATNGAQGIEQYKALRPDLVTMDIALPVIDGVSALEKIIEFDKDARIIMVGTLGKEDIIQKSLHMGAKSYIVKPLDRKKVIERVVSVLGGR